MAGVMNRMRAWQGPAILSYGFRPFFLLGALWAAGAMIAWILILTGRLASPGNLDPFSWHAHEFLFGYTGAAIGGFVLTAVPNWTGRLPVTGWPLAGLVALWVLGRVAMAAPADWGLHWTIVLAADLALAITLAGMILREVVSGRNWRNLPIAALIAFFALANAIFHIEAAHGLYAADGYGMRLGLSTVLILIALIGGRIIPSFTRNWLAARGAKQFPAPFGKPDAVVLALSALALIGFTLWPGNPATATLLLFAGLANFWRLARWQGPATRAEPLIWVLHLAYAALALGFVAEGAAEFGLLPLAAARHVWLAGAVGLMTLAVMSRASLGHTGRTLHAGPGLTACYIALALSVVARLAAGIWPEHMGLLHLSAGLWILAFGGFAGLFWPVLTGPRRERAQPVAP